MATGRAALRGETMRREDIIARRRELQVPDEFQDQWVTLADVGFDGEWVSPIQKISNCMDGPVLVAKHWFDAESVNLNREVLKRFGYLPGIPFNLALDRALACVGKARGDIYITQACHFLPRDDKRKTVPLKLMDLSVEAVTRYEVEGRRVIALGREAQMALERARIDFLPCPHPSSSVTGRFEELAEALRRST